MDSFERIQRLRDEYESALDDADRARERYHREIVKLHRSGMSLRDIADGLNISHQRVHQIVSPHDDAKSSSKAKRGAVAGAIAAGLLLGGGLLWEGEHARAPERASAAPRPSVSLAADCKSYHLRGSTFSPLEAAAQCQPSGTVVAIDPSTGRVLAVTTWLHRMNRTKDNLVTNTTCGAPVCPSRAPSP